MQPKYPNITVSLTGNDGNAFVIMGSVTTAMRRKKVPQEDISLFLEEAMSGNYDHLLQTCMKWVVVA